MSTAKPFSDHYETLNILPTSTAAEIKTAYKKKALECHPDKNGNSAEANESFKKIGAAYEVLGDLNRRILYDMEYRMNKAKGLYGKPAGNGSHEERQTQQPKTGKGRGAETERRQREERERRRQEEERKRWEAVKKHWKEDEKRQEEKQKHEEGEESERLEKQQRKKAFENLKKSFKSCRDDGGNPTPTEHPSSGEDREHQEEEGKNPIRRKFTGYTKEQMEEQDANARRWFEESLSNARINLERKLRQRAFDSSETAFKCHQERNRRETPLSRENPKTEEDLSLAGYPKSSEYQKSREDQESEDDDKKRSEKESYDACGAVKGRKRRMNLEKDIVDLEKGLRSCQIDVIEKSGPE